ITLRRVAVEHEDLPKVSAGGAQQIQSVSLGLRQRLLVAKDYPSRIIFHATQGNETTSFVASGPSGHGKKLRVGIQRGLRILNENAFPSPVTKISGRPGVDIVARLFRLPFTEDYANQIIRTRRLVGVLHLRRH